MVEEKPFKKIDQNKNRVGLQEVFEGGFTEDDPLADLRNHFYPESSDPLVERLSETNSVSEVLNLVGDVERLETMQLTQAVATIQHLQKLARHFNKARHDVATLNLMQDFNTQLKNSPHYSKLLNLIHDQLHQFPHNELAFILMCLSRFEEPLYNPVLRDIFLVLQRNINTLDLETLSYLSVGLRPNWLVQTGEDFRMVWRMAMAQCLPRLQHHLLNCSSPEELKQVAICFNRMTNIISDRMMDQLADKAMHLIKSGQVDRVDQDHLSTLNKLILLVKNLDTWHQEHGNYVYSLTSHLISKTQYMRPNHVLNLAEVLLSYGEPASLYYEVLHRLKEIIKTEEYQDDGVKLIRCLSTVMRLDQSAISFEEIEDHVKEVIDGPQLVYHMEDVYRILRSIGAVKDKRLVDKFFSRCLDYVRSGDLKAKYVASNYTNFWSPYTGHYRNLEFESEMTQIMKEDTEWTKYYNSPTMVAMKVQLLLSFGMELSPELASKLEACFPNMGPGALHNLARGIQTYFRRNKAGRWDKPFKDPSSAMNFADELNMMVSEASQKFVHHSLFHTQGKLDMLSLTRLVKSFSSRKELSVESHFNEIKGMVIAALRDHEMSTDRVNELSGTLFAREVNMTNVELLDAFADYVLRRPDPKEIHLMHIYRIFMASSKNGHKLPEEFLDLVSECLLRDMDNINCTSTLRTALALCSLNHLSKELARSVFSKEFMRKLDDEVEKCGGSGIYPKKLRLSLMELNRAVVLRYPEYGVPWFHDKYCIENMAKLREGNKSSTPEASVFRQEVYEELCALFGSWRFVREDTVSQYSNFVDFELSFDSSGHPIDMVSNPTSSCARKVALQIIPEHMFTEDIQKMKMKARDVLEELELQGWSVVAPNIFHWNSMQLAEPLAKRQYLESCIYGDEERRKQNKL